MSSRVTSIRLSDEDLARFKEAAKARRIPLNRWIRDACDKYAELGEQLQSQIEATFVGGGSIDWNSVSPTVTARNLTKPPKRLRTSMCEHRLPPGAFCKACD